MNVKNSVESSGDVHICQKYVKCYERSEEGNSRESSDVFVTVLCACAPTARATPGEKAVFSNDLQDTL